MTRGGVETQAQGLEDAECNLRAALKSAEYPVWAKPLELE